MALVEAQAGWEAVVFSSLRLPASFAISLSITVPTVQEQVSVFPMEAAQRSRRVRFRVTAPAGLAAVSMSMMSQTFSSTSVLSSKTTPKKAAVVSMLRTMVSLTHSLVSWSLVIAINFVMKYLLAPSDRFHSRTPPLLTTPHRVMQAGKSSQTDRQNCWQARPLQV